MLLLVLVLTGSGGFNITHKLSATIVRLLLILLSLLPQLLVFLNFLPFFDDDRMHECLESRQSIVVASTAQHSDPTLAIGGTNL